MTYTPILLLTGYLGSGKTTLLNHVLTNTEGIRFAVIVNDIGEVNIDADLIQKGGIVGQGEDDLVALQNGCICCTLRTDLMAQISELISTGKFDYIVIEASGVCEPEPIAQTICQMEQMTTNGLPVKSCPHLDCIVTVTDALRLKTEFGCGTKLEIGKYDEEDIENLIVQQIEFCNIIMLNKVSEVTKSEASHIKEVLRVLNPSAQIIECDYANVGLDKLLNTGMFDFSKAALGATWVQEIERDVDAEEEDHKEEKHSAHHHDHEHHHEHEHEHCHHGHHEHCHHHDEGEAEEYGIGTYVYFRRQPFNLEKFDRWVKDHWPSNVIRTKGIMYFSMNRDMSLLFEQAGIQKTIREAGQWYATAPEEELQMYFEQEPQLRKDWDEKYGDRMEKLVFIGRNLDRKRLASELDACLESE